MLFQIEKDSQTVPSKMDEMDENGLTIKHSTGKIQNPRQRRYTKFPEKENRSR